MTTAPDVPVPDDGEQPDAGLAQPESAPGVEFGMSEEAGTFEPQLGAGRRTGGLGHRPPPVFPPQLDTRRADLAGAHALRRRGLPSLPMSRGETQPCA
jgi:hypothetical protein